MKLVYFDVIPCDTHGVTNVTPCDTHGVTNVIPCDTHGVTIVNPCDTHGVTIVNPCDTHGITLYKIQHVRRWSYVYTHCSLSSTHIFTDPIEHMHVPVAHIC